MKISSLDLKMFRLLEDLIALGMILNNAEPLEVKEWNLTVYLVVFRPFTL